MDDSTSADDTLHRRAPAATRKAARSGAEAAAEAEPHEQAPLLGSGDRGGSDHGDDDEQTGGAQGLPSSGADDGFDEWEGLPWYKRPSVRCRPFSLEYDFHLNMIFTTFGHFRSISF
jgi:hypothetical protein